MKRAPELNEKFRVESMTLCLTGPLGILVFLHLPSKSLPAEDLTWDILGRIQNVGPHAGPSLTLEERIASGQLIFLCL